MAEEDAEQHGKAKVLERKKWNMSDFIQKTPCVRSSLINGIISGLAVGFGSFMYSKRIKKSCDIAVGTFSVCSLVSWSYCYYNRWVQLKKLDDIVVAMKKNNLKSDNDKELDGSAIAEDVNMDAKG